MIFVRRGYLEFGTIMRYLFLGLALFCLHCKQENTMQQEPFKIHAFRLKPGQDLKQEIEAFTRRENIEAGWIMTCVGSLTQTTLRFANQPESVKSTGHFEIVSLVGTVSVHGSHLHLSVSDSTGQTIGGHLSAENLVFTTAEIVLGESKTMVFTRENDGSTPWKELQVRKR